MGHDLVANLNNLTFLDFLNNVCFNDYARDRAEVLSLATQLSVLCPPLDVTMTATTTEPTNIDHNTDQCLCDQELGKLQELNRALGIQVANLQEWTRSLRERLLEVETKLKEIAYLLQ